MMCPINGTYSENKGFLEKFILIFLSTKRQFLKLRYFSQIKTLILTSSKGTRIRVQSLILFLVHPH